MDQVDVIETGVPDQLVSYTYDAQDRLKTTTRNGVTTTLEYDGIRVKSVQEPGLSSSVTFDANSRPKTVTEQGVTATFGYNAQGRLATETAQGATHTFTYASGQQVQQHKVTDASGLLLTEDFTYDSVGRVHTVTTDGATYEYEYFPDNSTRRVTIDSIERNLVEKNKVGLATKISLFGGAIETTFADFNPTSGQPQQRITKLLDGTTLTRMIAYDSMGRLKSYRDPVGITQTIEYDDFGYVKKQTDADGVVTQRTFSPTGLPLTQTFADGTAVNYSYNNDLTVHTKGGVTYNYDAEMLPSKVDYPDGTHEEYLARNSLMFPEQVKLGSVAHILGYTNGRLSSMSAVVGPGQVTFTHDGLGRVTQITRGGQFINYTYSHHAGVLSETAALGTWSVVADHLARIASENYPSGWSHTYAPDATGLPTAVQQVGIDQINRRSDQPKRVHFTDGREIRWTFDPASRVTGIEYRNQQGIVAGFDYALTPGGRVLSETRRHENASDVFLRQGTAQAIAPQWCAFLCAEFTGRDLSHVNHRG